VRWNGIIFVLFDFVLSEISTSLSLGCNLSFGMMTSGQRSRECITCDESFIQVSWSSKRKARNEWGGEEGKCQYLSDDCGMHFEEYLE
jgi:hypothetical protein